MTALASTYRDGSRTIIVSTALSRACDSGANDKGPRSSRRSALCASSRSRTARSRPSSRTPAVTRITPIQTCRRRTATTIPTRATTQPPARLASVPRSVVATCRVAHVSIRSNDVRGSGGTPCVRALAGQCFSWFFARASSGWEPGRQLRDSIANAPLLRPGYHQCREGLSIAG